MAFTGFNFTVSLTESASATALISVAFGLPAQGGFSEVSGLELTMQPDEYKEGGNNGLTLKFPSRATWANLKLKHGIVTDPDLWNWHLGFVSGKGKRRDGTVTMLDQNGAAVRSWHFTRGLPVRWVGPALNATQASVAFEEIEIAHEGLAQTGGDGTLLGALKSLF
jgi:phage tail-like protein